MFFTDSLPWDSSPSSHHLGIFFQANLSSKTQTASLGPGIKAINPLWCTSSGAKPAEMFTEKKPVSLLVGEWVNCHNCKQPEKCGNLKKIYMRRSGSCRFWDAWSCNKSLWWVVSWWLFNFSDLFEVDFCFGAPQQKQTWRFPWMEGRIEIP